MATITPLFNLGMGAAAAGANYFGRKRQKRRDTSDEVSVDHRPRHAVGGGSLALRKSQGKTSENGGHASRLSRIMAEAKLKECSIVARYQWLSQNWLDSDNLHFQLNKQWTTAVEGPSGTMKLPVYAFNLSSLAFANVSTANPTIPFYRLQKYVTTNASTDSTVRNYHWDRQVGQDRTVPSNLTYGWQLEKRVGWGGDTTIKTNSHYFWKWSDIELSFKSTNFAPTKVHVALVRFNNTSAGPRRSYLVAGVPTQYDPEAIVRDANESDLWYDAWLARKVVHPLRRTEQMDMNKPITFLQYECICLEPNGDKQTTFTSKLFHTANKLLRCVNPTAAEASHEPDINTGASGATPLVKWNKSDSTMFQQAFPDQRKDTWLMIWADDFSGIVSSVGSSGPSCSSFDLMIRSKFLVSTT